MGKIDLPYVERNVAKGRIYYRYRRDGQRLSLPKDPLSAEFLDAYNRIHNSFETEGEDPTIIIPGSVADLVMQFKKSSEFIELAERTKELYRDHLDDITEKFGRFPIKGMTRKVALEYRDSYAEMPGKANNSIKIMSRLYSFAVDRTMIVANPLLRIKKLKMGQYRGWTMEEINSFREVAPDYMKIALDLALYTGQRQSDVIKMRWNQIKDNGIEVKQQKTGVSLWIPIHKKLHTTLEKARKAQRVAHKVMPTTIVATRNGKPYNRGWFVAEWIETADKAKLPDECVFHGLRAAASSFLAEAGCTDEQIQSITGHTTKSMVEHYTKSANQKIMVKAAIKKFENKR